MKAQAIAHYLEDNLRQAYAFEKQKEAAPETKEPGVGAYPNWSMFRQGGGK